MARLNVAIYLLHIDNENFFLSVSLFGSNVVFLHDFLSLMDDYK